jgi:hypothetical protein
MEDAEMKKQIVTGLIGAASLLAMAATTSYALGTPCADATITSVGAGYAESPKGGPYREIGVVCNDTDPGTPATYKVYPSSAVDLDGIMATALTAAVEGYPVKYSVYPYAGTDMIISMTAKLSTSTTTTTTTE